MSGKRGKAKSIPTSAKVSGGSVLVRTILKIIFSIGIVACVIALIAWLGSTARDQIVDRERYTVRFAEIDCAPPPGRDRTAFLAEVRYVGELPETVQSIDPTLPERLKAAFVKHPWVAEVKRITIDAQGKIKAELRFRVPVLAVAIPGEPEPRCVDRTGVLLPNPPKMDSLPLLATTVIVPKTQEGQVWNDPVVKRAAELADLYTPKKLEKIDKGWRITQADGKVFIMSH